MEKIKAYTGNQRIILQNITSGKMQVQKFPTGEIFGLLLPNEPVEVDPRQLDFMEVCLHSDKYCVEDLIYELDSVFITKLYKNNVLIEFRAFEPKEN